MVKSNVPQERYITLNDKEKFYIGDNVRIHYPEWTAGIIGHIHDIFSDHITIEVDVLGIKEVPFSKIWKMRKVGLNENFETVPYYDDEEREFWRTHWRTKDGIKEKTKEEMMMLDEFCKEHKGE